MLNTMQFIRKENFVCMIFRWQVLEDKISALPWLEDKKQQLTEEEEEKNKTLGMFGQPPIKPYVSGEKINYE